MTISVKEKTIKNIIRKKTKEKNEFTEQEVLEFADTISEDNNSIENDIIETFINKHLYLNNNKKKYYFRVSKKSNNSYYTFIKNNMNNDNNETESESEDSEKLNEELRLLQKKTLKNNYKFPLENYKAKKYVDSNYGPFGSQWVHDNQIDDEYDEDTKKRAKQYDILKKIVLPEQRTKEWFEMRTKKITASDGGCVMGVNKYEQPWKFILKKLEPQPFTSNKFCYHGTKLEEIATMIYEYRMNVKVEEFGLMGHKNIDFLGASPDGIVSRYKLNGINRTKHVGRMLEIKCPFTRQIKKKGDIYDNICPAYYWVQVQQQLECCNLSECDFWQCNIGEYNSREEFIQDTKSDEPFRSEETGFEKGCLIQLIPINMIEKSRRSINEYNEVVYNYSKFLYPPKIEMSPNQCDNWISDTLSKYRNSILINGCAKIDDKNIISFDPSKYVFDKVIYWKLKDSHNVTIKRDRKWFKNSFNVYEKMWNYVCFFRNNPKQKEIFLNYVNTKNYKNNKSKRINDNVMEICDILLDINHPDYDNRLKIIKDDIQSFIIKKEKEKENKNKYDEYENLNDYAFIE